MDDKGGADAGPMLEYGQKGLDLQKEIYNDQKQMSQPWYNTGSAAVGQLSKLLGLGGNAATGNKTEAQLRQEYMPSYTTGSQAGMPAGGVEDNSFLNWTTPDMQATGGYTVGNNKFVTGKNGLTYTTTGTGPSNAQWNVVGSSGGQTVDNQGLDQAVARALAAQSAAGSAAESDPAYGSLAKSFGMDDYEADPGYQFRLAEGNKALERQLNAQGKTFSPEAVKALQTYGQGVASEEYGNAYNRYNNDQGNLFNRLATLSGFGQTATGQVGAAGQNYANQGTELYTGMGNSIASAQQANQASKGSMFNTLANIAGTGAKLYAMSDMRLKEDIIPMGRENGHKVYAFRYKGKPQRYVGVMAQQVLKTNPEAVKMIDGFYAVNYDAIGVRMREV